MTRDYKHRARSRAEPSPAPVAGWKWLLIILLIAGFGFFLYSLRDSEPSNTNSLNIPPITKAKPAKIKPVPKKVASAKEPRFDFYTILPEKEVVITEKEVKTRKRDEKIDKAKVNKVKVNKAKVHKYQLQAGSFKNFKEADRLRAQLALMGVESRVEKAKIGNVLWNRIKIGPYSSMATADRVRKRLRKNNIDAVVMKIPG